ncbi:hypothetical protein, partial [Escherichia coli]|uniref:hypothetical protein n=1 Tax=Escherichia coli TaxID=562 RepID=UPI001AA1A147
TLITNIPLEFKLSDSKLNDLSFLNLISLFKTFNFKSLIQRIEKQTSVKIKPVNNSTQTSLF